MGKKKEKTKIFIQRRYTNDQWAYEKILDIISNDRNSNQNCNDVLLHSH